jgi:hypothetical protein
VLSVENLDWLNHDYMFGIFCFVGFRGCWPIEYVYMDIVLFDQYAVLMI